MGTISPEYTALNEKLHRERFGFGNDAKRFTPDIGKWLNSFYFHSFLDYGCGKESFISSLRAEFPQLVAGKAYLAYDPAVPHRREKPQTQVDVTISTDVLEHIEPEYLDAVLAEIKAITRKRVYFNIAIKPSGDILPDGRNAHLIVQPPEWWRATLEKAFEGWSVEERAVLTPERNYTITLTRPRVLNVTCLYWKGPDDRRYPGWQNESLGVEYVNRLFRGVSRNMTVPFRFICFTNVEGFYTEGVEIRAFDPPSWNGCFPKLWVHSPDSGLEGRVLTFDLDNVIVGSLDDFGRYDKSFTTRMEPMRGRRMSAGDLLGFEAGETYGLWKNFLNTLTFMEGHADGDERIVYNTLWKNRLKFWQEELPGQFISFKREVHLNRGVVPRNARVVTFHGKPRPHEVTADWVKECWK